jgi:hypothetical protein
MSKKCSKLLDGYSRFGREILSKHIDSFILDLPIKQGKYVLKKVIVDLNWRVLEQTNTYYKIKEVSSKVTSFTFPAQIEIEIKETYGKLTEVTLYGSIMGLGPIQSNHLKGQMGNFRNRLELEAINN